jgi:hypothetical protein
VLVYCFGTSNFFGVMLVLLNCHLLPPVFILAVIVPFADQQQQQQQQPLLQQQQQ